MSKRSSKRKELRSMNDLIFNIVQSFTVEGQSSSKDTPQKNAAAVALEKLNKRKAHKAKAAKLSPKKRTALAKKEAAARWGKA